jgi:3D (Asp-Asp-Asp) domain-containing protein
MLLATALLLSRALAQTQETTPDGALLTPLVTVPNDPVATDPVATDPSDPIPSEPVGQTIPPITIPAASPSVDPTATDSEPLEFPRSAAPRSRVIQPAVTPATNSPAANSVSITEAAREARAHVPTTAPASPKVVPAVSKPVPAAKPAKLVAKPALKAAAKPARKPAAKPRKPVVASKTYGKTIVVRSTAYNSLPGQTDASPFKTATGARTRFGIVALSRDLLRSIPYGSRIVLEDMGTWANGSGRGRYNAMLSRMVFVVEDTMHPRKTGTVDVWFPARRQAIQWGARRLRVRIVQVGR